MNDIQEKFKAFVKDVEEICSHVSVRDDENGPYVFALGLKETHTLQLRKINEQYVLEMWHGKTAETERVAKDLVFSEIEEAFEKAKGWLSRDAI